MLALALISELGTLAAALFIAPWAIIILSRPNLALESVIRNGWLLAIPSFAVLSVIWSEAPDNSLRHAIQFLFTILIAIWASSCIRPKLFMSTLFTTGLLVLGLSLAIGNNGVDERTGEYVLVGIFYSKNQLALYASLFIFAALAIAFDRSQMRPLRILALGAIGPAFWALVVSRSTGSILFVAVAVAAVLALQVVSRLPRGTRFVFFAIIFMLFIAALAAAGFVFGEFGLLLDSLGKDASLTGRTDLWESALDLISAHPFLGVGYNAFWYIGNPEAERLWAISHVNPGAGFNFHNLYLNTGVELGLIGVALLIIQFVLLTCRIVLSMVIGPKPKHFFAAGIFLYFLMLSFVEAYFLYEFHVATVLLAVCWCLSRPEMPGMRKPQASDR